MTVNQGAPCHRSNYTQGRREGIAYLVVHYTGNDGDTARANCTYFAGEHRNASAHYFVDEDGAWQSVQDGDTAWHCGAASYRHPICRNANSIGVELCSRKMAGEYGFAALTYANGVALLRQLRAVYQLPKGRVLRHYDVTGKRCPAPLVEELRWQSFVSEVEGEEEAPLRYDRIEDVPLWGRETVEKLVERDVLRGTGEGLALTEDIVRLLVLHDRLGLYEEA